MINLLYRLLTKCRHKDDRAPRWIKSNAPDDLERLRVEAHKIWQPSMTVELSERITANRPWGGS